MLGSQNKKYVIVPHNYLKISQIIIDYWHNENHLNYILGRKNELQISDLISGTFETINNDSVYGVYQFSPYISGLGHC